MSDTTSAGGDPPPTPPPAATGFWRWLMRLSSVVFAICFLILLADPLLESVQDLRARWGEMFATDHGLQKRIGITVASPSVHTRERLLNDRFEQLAWLETQLKATNSPIPDAKPAVNSEPATASEAPAEAKGRVAGSSTSSQTVVIGQGTPRYDFEVMNGYRDVLRAERASAMLDDRHDMDGNTIYLLSFDATVLPAARMQEFAAVEALVTREPKEMTAGAPGLEDSKKRLDNYKYQDTFDVYLNWLERLRKLDDEVVRSMGDTLHSSGTSLPPELANLLPTLEVAACIHERAKEVRTAGNNKDTLREQERQLRQDCLDALKRYQHNDNGYEPPANTADATIKKVFGIVETQVEQARDVIRRQFESQASVHAGEFQKALKQLLEKPEVFLSPEVISRISHVIANPRDATWSFDEAKDECQGGQLRKPKHADLYEMIDTYLTPDANSWRHPPGLPPPLEEYVHFECPTEVTPLQRALFLSSIIIDPPSQKTKYLPPHSNHDSPALANIQSSTCVAAIWLREQAASRTASSPRNHGAGLDEFFDFSVDELEDGTCHLVILPRIRSLRGPPPPDESSNSTQSLDKCDNNLDTHDIKLLERLDCLLEGPGYSNGDKQPISKSYSYGLSPRLRDHVHAHNQRAANASVNGLVGLLQYGQNADVTRDSTDPEVVGFSRPGLAKREDGALHSISGARFGWLIAPRADAASSQQSGLQVQQVQLGALLAVPSWWRTALLQICTGAVRRSETGKVVGAEFWDHNERCHVEILRLPGNAADVARHLGTDVLTYPAVWQPPSDDGNPPIPPMIYADDRSRPASILIRGERLWRSTVVALGGQEQDHIQVLPDMSGIIATFRCVDFPTLHNGALPKTQNSAGPGDDDLFANYFLYNVPLSVWTSEGHSEDFRTTVAVAKSEAARKRAQPCHPSVAAPTPAPDGAKTTEVP